MMVVPASVSDEVLATPQRGILLSCGHWTDYGDILGVWPGYGTTCTNREHGQGGRTATILATNITAVDGFNLYRNRIDPMLFDGKIVDQEGRTVAPGDHPRCIIHEGGCAGYHTYEATVPARVITEDLTHRLQMANPGEPTEKIHGLLLEAAQAITDLREGQDVLNREKRELAAALDAAIERENHPLVRTGQRFDTYIASAEALDAISGAIARLNAIFTMSSGVDLDMSAGVSVTYEGVLIGRLVQVGDVFALDVRQY